MKLLHKLVRKLSRFAWRKEITIADGMSEIEELHATPGKMKLHIQQRPALAQYIALGFAEIIHKSENYTELKFEVAQPTVYGEWITVTVQKNSGKTPHEFRVALELEVAKLKAENICLKKTLSI